MRIITIPFATHKVEKNSNGEYVYIKEGESTRPALLTNYALQYGYKNKMIETTNIADLFSSFWTNQDSAYTAIYLGLVGANPNLPNELTFDEMKETIDILWSNIAYVASTITNPELPETFQEWVEELDKKTEKDPLAKKP